MQSLKWFLGSLVLVGACAHKEGAEGGGSKSAPASVEEAAKAKSLPIVRIAYSARVVGEVGECGCAMNPKGGLDKRWHFLETERKTTTPLLVVDAGNALFAQEHLDRGFGETQRQRAALILKGHGKMGVQAQNVGALDLTAGLDFLRLEAERNRVPLVSSNLLDTADKPLFPQQVDLESGGFKVRVIGFTAGPEKIPEGMKVADVAPILKRLAKDTPADRLLVVLSDLGRDSDLELAATLDRNALWVESRDLGSLETPIFANNALVVQPQIQGQQWGVLSFGWNPKSEGWWSPELYARLSARPPGEVPPEFKKVLKGPGDRLVFEQRLVAMNAEWTENNELTPLIKKLEEVK